MNSVFLCFHTLSHLNILALSLIYAIEDYHKMFDIENGVCSIYVYRHCKKELRYIMFHVENHLQCALRMLHYLKHTDIDVF